MFFDVLFFRVLRGVGRRTRSKKDGQIRFVKILELSQANQDWLLLKSLLESMFLKFPSEEPKKRNMTGPRRNSRPLQKQKAKKEQSKTQNKQK